MLPKIKSLYDLAVPNNDLVEIPQVSAQMAQNSTALPPVERKPAGGMSDYELTQNASRDAKAAGVAQMTPEKRAHWARLDNEFAAEKIRRKEEKEQQKKMAVTTNQIGNMVRSGALTPEKAVEVAKLHDIEVNPDYMANYLPKIRDSRRPQLPTLDEYKQQKFAQQQAESNISAGLPPDISPEVRSKIELDRAKANEANSAAVKNTLPPVVSDLDRANTEKVRKETEQIGVAKPQPPVAISAGQSLVDPVSGKVIVQGQQKDETPKGSYEDNLIEEDLRAKLGREPSPSEILEARNAVQLKPLSPTETTKLAALKNTEKELAELVEAYRTDYSGWFDNMMAKKGTTAGWTSSDETEFRRKLLANTTDFMYSKGGKQLSDKEMVILKSTMPQLGMGDKAFKAALIGFYQQVGNIIANREQEFRDKGYKVDDELDTTKNDDPLGIR